VQVGAGGERRLARGLAERAPVVAPVGGWAAQRRGGCWLRV